MTGSRGPLIRSLLAFSTLLAPFGYVGAEDDADPRRQMREVEIPLGSAEFTRWIDAGWEPIDATRYRRFRDVAVDDTELVPRVQRAEYRARFEQGSLVEGAMKAELRLPPDTPSPWLVDLAPLSLPVSNLRTTDGPLVSGITEDGKKVVRADSADTTVLADWSLEGRAALDAHEFDVAVARATVSTLRIQLPADHVLQSDYGIVRRLDSIDGPENAEWLVDLGTRTSCRLRVSHIGPKTGPSRPILVTERRMEFSVEPDSIGFRTTIELAPVRSSIDRIRVAIPIGARIERVELGSDTPLSWNNVSSGEGSAIVIRLPDPLTGPSRPIVVRGRSPLEVDERWSLPRFEVTGVRTNGVEPMVLSEGGRLELAVAAPLRLNVVALRGMRRVAPEFEVSEGTAIAFEEAATAPMAEVQVSYPELVARATVATLVDTRAPEWTLQSAIRWAARAGRSFRLRLRVPRGWRITAVRSGSGGESEVTGWRLRRDLGGVQVVTVDLLGSLSPQSPRTIVVEGAIDTSRAGPREVRPVVQPYDCDVVDSLLLLDGPVDWKPILLDANDFEPRAVDDLTEDHLELLDEFSLDELNRLDMFRTRKPGASVLLDTGAGSHSVKATTTVDIDEENRPVVRRELEYSSSSRPPVVMFAAEPRAGDWEIASRIDEEWTSPGSVTWQSTPLADGNEGAGWRPVVRPATVGVVRLRSQPATLEPERAAIHLPAVPDAPFVGRVVFSRAAAAVWQPRLPDSIPRDLGELGLEWTYTTADHATLTTRSDTSTEHEVAAADASLTTFFGTDRIRHELVLTTIPNGSGRLFEFALPDGVELQDCLVDDRPVRGSDGTPRSVRLPTTSNPHRITIRYFEDRPRSTWQTTVSAIWPSTTSTIRERRWRLAIPPDWIRSERHHDGSSLPWTQRLFGPLGRAGGFDPFNPLLVESWVPSNPAGPSQVHESDTVPEGWNVHSIDVSGDGSAATTLVHATSNEVLSWVVLFGTLLACVIARLVRRRSERTQPKVWPIVILTLAVSAWTLPDERAMLAGGAISGLILGLLLPFELLERRGHGTVSTPVTDGSTMSFRYAPHLLAALAALQSIVTSAQEPVSMETAPDDDLVVVTPFVADGQPPQVVYVSKRTRGLVEDFESERARGEQFVVETAEYRADLSAANSPTITATFRVAVFDDVRPVVVELPIREGNLSGRTPCLVNGRPVAVEPGTSPENVRIEIDSSIPRRGGSLEIACVLHPPVESRGDRSGTGLRVPPVPQSRLVVTGLAREHTLEVSGESNGAPATLGVRKSDSQSHSVALGPLEAFSITWGPPVENVSRMETVAVATTASYDLSPTITRLRCRVRLMSDAPGRTIAWEIPERFGVESVVTSAKSEFAVTESTAGGTRVLVRTSESTGGIDDGVLDVDFGLVTSTVARDGTSVDLPTTTFLRPVAEGGVEFVIASTRIGVAAGAEWQPLQVDAAVVGVRTLTTDAFQEDVNDWGLPAPQLAFSLDGDVAPTISLEPRRARRLGRQTTRHLVGRTESNWTYEADLVVEEAPAFGHRFRVPKSLVVESVSVTANDRERVASWDRETEAVVVQLSERLVGRHRVRLSGWMPVDLETEFELSRPELEDADIEESELVVAAAPTVGLEIAANDPALDRIPGPLDRPVPTTWRLLGRFDVDAGTGPFLVRASTPSTMTHVTAFNRLRRSVDGDWSLDTQLRIEPMQGTIDRVQVELPDGFDLREVMVRDGTTQQVDDQIEVVFASPLRESRPVTVELSGDVVEPTGSNWVLRTPGLAGEGLAHDNVLVVDSNLWATVGSLPVVPVEELPGEFHSLANVPVGSPSNSWSLSRVDSPEISRIVLVESELRCSRAHVEGTTRAVVRGSRPTLEFEVVDDYEVESVTVDGLAVPVTDVGDGEVEGWAVLSIPLPSSSTRTLVRIDWRDARSSRWPVVLGRVDLPRFRDIEVDRVLALVSGTNHETVRLGNAAQRLDAADFALERLDGLLATSTRGETCPRWYAELIGRRLDEATETIEGEDESEELTTLRLERLSEAADRLDSLQPLGGESVSDWGDPEHRGIPVRLPATASSMLLGHVPTWLSPAFLGGIAFAGLLVVGCVIWRLRGQALVDLSPAASMALLGVLWWTCLRGGGLGLLLLVTSAWLFFKHRDSPDYDRSELVV